MERPRTLMLDILYRDASLIAIHKPSGLLVHRSQIDRHETRFAVQLLRDQIGQHVFPVHRLDKGTSGILLFALNRDTAAELTRMLTAREVDKRYLAVVRGFMPEPEGLIDHPLKPIVDDMDGKAGHVAPDAQPALTRYRQLATTELPYQVDRYPVSRYALLELSPETGRQHQLRRHLKHVSHPIIGDATYGKGRHNRLFSQLFGVQRLLLAAHSMSFRHPHRDEQLNIRCPLAEDFAKVVESLGWGNALS